MIDLLLSLAIAAAPAQAERHDPMPSVPAAVACAPQYPPALAGWPNARPATGQVDVGRAADLAARPIVNVRLAIAPTKPLSGTHFASASFAVKAAGTYQVAAGGVGAPVKPLWLDVAGADNKPLTSVGHGHGAACSSITKVVEFRLAPGRYTVLATGLTSAAPIRVLIVRKP